LPGIPPEAISAETGTTRLRVTEPLSVANNPDETYQYSLDGSEWQDSPLFEGLYADTEYTVYAKRLETETHEESDPITTVVRTDAARIDMITDGDAKDLFTVTKPDDETILSIIEEEIQDVAVKRQEGKGVLLKVTITNKDDTVGAEEKKQILDKLSENAANASVLQYYDITVHAVIMDPEWENELESVPVTDLGEQNALTITLNVPNKFKADMKTERTFHIIRVHEGISILYSSTDVKLPFSSHLFSTYALGATDVELFMITFETTGDSAIDPIIQAAGTEVTAPADPTWTGYTFIGWDKEIPEKMPAEDLTIKAQWKINSYTITFDTDGGSTIAPIKQNYDTAVTKPADPTKTGYTFIGWDKTIPEKMPAGNMTIKAKWKINQYTITFDTDGGSAIAQIKQDYNSVITKPANPTKAGYTFIGWDKEIPEKMPAGNMTIKALWKKTDNGKSVNTGDDTNLPLLITLLAVLIAGMAGFNIVQARKKKKANRN